MAKSAKTFFFLKQFATLLGKLSQGITPDIGGLCFTGNYATLENIVRFFRCGEHYCCSYTSACDLKPVIQFSSQTVVFVINMHLVGLPNGNTKNTKLLLMNTSVDILRGRL